MSEFLNQSAALSVNPFKQTKGWRQRKEKLGINLLRLATYIIIAPWALTMLFLMLLETLPLQQRKLWKSCLMIKQIRMSQL